MNERKDPSLDYAILDLPTISADYWAQLVRCLRPGGKIIVYTSNAGYLLRLEELQEDLKKAAAPGTRIIPTRCLRTPAYNTLDGVFVYNAGYVDGQDAPVMRRFRSPGMSDYGEMYIAVYEKRVPPHVVC